MWDYGHPVVLKDGVSAGPHQRAASVWLLVLRQQRLEARVVAEGVPHGVELKLWDRHRRRDRQQVVELVDRRVVVTVCVSAVSSRTRTV